MKFDWKSFGLMWTFTVSTGLYIAFVIWLATTFSAWYFLILLFTLLCVVFCALSWELKDES